MKNNIFCILLLTVSLPLIAEENYDWLTTGRSWWVEDGRELVDPKADFIYWNKPPNVKFEKLEIPPGSIVYQGQLRNELFYFVYETEEEPNKLYSIGSVYGTRPWQVEFKDDYSFITEYRGTTFWGSHHRVGKQENQRHPLVGIWGSLPALTEYRLSDSTDCLYYFEIDNIIPGWAVRKGTYLLKEIKENVFETISSFPEGKLRLEIRNEKQILVLPLFTAAKDERRRVAPLRIRRQ